MGYFGGSSRFAGDPGFFGALKSIGRRIGRGAVGFAEGGPLGAARGLTRSSRQTPRAFQAPQRKGVIPFIASAFVGPKPVTIDPVTGDVMRRRRRMNAGNAKALRRAIRRTDAFVRLSKSALKNTGFKIVSKSSGKVSRATMDKAVAAAHHRGT